MFQNTGPTLELFLQNIGCQVSDLARLPKTKWPPGVLTIKIAYIDQYQTYMCHTKEKKYSNFEPEN
jgi:hypothetical protein